MALKRSKRFYKNQLEIIEEYQDDLDSVDFEFAELKARKASLKKKIKGVRDDVIDEGGEELLQEWDEKRAAKTAGGSTDAPDASGEPSAEGDASAAQQ